MSKSIKCGISGCGSDETKDTDLKFLKVPLCGSRRYKLWWKTLFGSAYLFGGGLKHENYICSKHFLQDDVDYLNPILHLNNIPRPKVGQEVDIHLERRRLFILLNNALLEWARRFDSFAPSAIPKSKFITTGLKIQKMLGLQTITFDDFWWKNFRITHLFSVDRYYSHKTTNLEQILKELDPNVKIYPENNESALNASPIEISQKMPRRITRRIRRKRVAGNPNDNEGEGRKNIDRYSYSMLLEGINVKSIDNILLKPKEELQIFPPNMETLQTSIDGQISLSLSEISEKHQTNDNGLIKNNHNPRKRVLDREIICPSKKPEGTVYQTDPYKTIPRRRLKKCLTKNPIGIKSFAQKISNTKNVSLRIKDESKTMRNMHATLLPPRTNNENDHKDPPEDFMPDRRLFNTANLRTYTNTRKKKLNINCENPAVPSDSSTSTLTNNSGINSENVSKDIKKEPCEEFQTNDDFLSNRTQIKTEEENINRLDGSISVFHKTDPLIKTEQHSNCYKDPNGMNANLNLLNEKVIPMLEIKSEHYEHNNTNDNADAPIAIPTIPQYDISDSSPSEGKSYSEVKVYIKALEDYDLINKNNRSIRTYSNSRKNKLTTNCENPAVLQKPSGSKNALEPAASKLRIDSSTNSNSENVSETIKTEPCGDMQINNDFSSIYTQIKTEVNVNKLDRSKEDSNYYKDLSSISDINLLNEEAIPKLQIKSEHYEDHNTNENAGAPFAPFDIPTVPKHASDDPSAGEWSEIQIKSYSEALEYIKPLEDYVLLSENYRLIDLVRCLEEHLKCCAQSQESNE